MVPLTPAPATYVYISTVASAKKQDLVNYMGNLRVKVLISVHVGLKLYNPACVAIPGTVAERLLKGLCKMFVPSTRLLDFKQKGIPSDDI